jgi:hypothetical protein
MSPDEVLPEEQTPPAEEPTLIEAPDSGAAEPELEELVKAAQQAQENWDKFVRAQA